MSLLARYITVVWPFIFLAGLLWGGYRNYRQQKQALGVAVAGSPMQEFRQAVSDIAQVSQAVFNQNAPEAAPEDEGEQELNIPPTAESNTMPVQDQAEAITEESTTPVPPNPPAGGPPVAPT